MTSSIVITVGELGCFGVFCGWRIKAAGSDRSGW